MENTLADGFKGEKAKENCYFIIPAGTKHAYGADVQNPWSIYWMHFNGENIDMFQSIIGKLIHIEHSEQVISTAGRKC